MVKKRWIIVPLVVIGLGLLAGYGVWEHFLVIRPGVTLANFDRLREGMSFEEVQTSLGRPPDCPPFEFPNGSCAYGWEGDALTLGIVFSGPEIKTAQAGSAVAADRSVLRKTFARHVSVIEIIRSYIGIAQHD